MRLLPWRIHPSNALCDEAMNARIERRRNQVLSTLTAHASISLRSFRHLAEIETGRQISELMDDDVRLSMQNILRHRRGIEDIDHDRLHAGGTQPFCLG